MSRITSDILTLQNVISSSVSIVADFLTIVGLVSWILWINFKLAIISFIALPFIGVTIVKFSRRLRRIAKNLQNTVGDLTSVLQENISGIRTIKSNGAEKSQIEFFEEENNKNFRANMKNAQTTAMILPIVELLNTTGLVIVLGYGGWLVIKSGDSGFTPGDLISFLTALGMLLTPMKRLTNVNNYIQQMSASLERIYEILDESREDDETMGMEKLEDVRFGVEFSDVSFTYEGTQAGVKNISFKVEAGKSLAIVGPSGGGKTTIINLLQRFYKIDGGEILVDGKNIWKLELESLRSHIGVVPQNPILFSWSVKDNIGFGNIDYSMEDIVKAAKMANAHDFIMQLPNGYDTKIGEHGVKISGGQRQRIAIARAIIRDPGILILDEATSALDSATEKQVQAAIDEMQKDRTTIIIAHRLSTVKKADRIVVLLRGEIIEQGSHQDLIDAKGEYASLYKHQFES